MFDALTSAAIDAVLEPTSPDRSVTWDVGTRLVVHAGAGDHGPRGRVPEKIS